MCRRLHSVNQWCPFQSHVPRSWSMCHSNCQMLMQGTEMLVKINLGWHTDYIMAMSMSGAVRTCVTHDSAASKSDVTALEQHLEKLWESGRGNCQEHFAWGTHPLCFPQSDRAQAPFLGAFPRLWKWGPDSHSHSPHAQTSLQSWQGVLRGTRGRFWLCYSSFLPLELSWCGSQAAERLPGGILWLEGHCSGCVSHWHFRLQGHAQGMASMEEQESSQLDCSQSCRVPGVTAAGDTGEPLGAAGTHRRWHFPLVLPPGYRWMSHKLRAPLPRRLLGSHSDI